MGKTTSTISKSFDGKHRERLGRNFNEHKKYKSDWKCCQLELSKIYENADDDEIFEIILGICILHFTFFGVLR